MEKTNRCSVQFVCYGSGDNCKFFKSLLGGCAYKACGLCTNLKAQEMKLKDMGFNIETKEAKGE